MNSKDTYNLALNYDIVFARKGDKITLANTRPFLKYKITFTASHTSGSVINESADERLWDLNLPLLSLWGSCQGKFYCSRDISKLQAIKFPPGTLPRKKIGHT